MQERKKGLKICHLTSAHPVYDVRILLKECVSLANAGFETYLVAATEKDENYRSVCIVSVKKSSGGRIRRMIKTVNQVKAKALEIDADVYHLHDPELLRIAHALKRKGKKVIYDAHEDVPLQILGKYWIPKVFRKLVSALFRNYENKIGASLDGIVTATSFIAKRFRGVNSNIITINNYPFLQEFNRMDSYTEKKNQVVYIGGLSENRGLFEMIRAMQKTEHITLALAGSFSPAELEERAKKEAGWEKIDYKGQLDRSGVAQLLAESKAGLVVLHDLPNYLDSQPIKMFEYMSASIPVIASDFPYWRSIIETHQCGICVNPYDKAAIAAAIQHLSNERDEAKIMGINGRKAIEEQFNWEKEAIRLVNFYQKISGKDA